MKPNRKDLEKSIIAVQSCITSVIKMMEREKYRHWKIMLFHDNWKDQPMSDEARRKLVDDYQLAKNDLNHLYGVIRSLKEQRDLLGIMEA